MKKHETSIKYEGGLEKLANDLGDLRYDTLEKFLNLLSEKLVKDSEADKKRKRTKLAGRLNKSATLISYAANEVKEAWKISAPHMKKADKVTLFTKEIESVKSTYSAEAHAPLNDTCEKCGRVYCDHENKY